MSYKELHESFVSGHNGTTQTEITLLTSASVFPVLLRDLLSIVLVNTGSPWLWLVVDFVVTILPLQLLCTTLSDYIIDILIKLIIVCGVLIFIHCRKHLHSSTLTFSQTLDLPSSARKHFITNYRTYVNVSGAISILGVDFTIFPRKFAKAETYGTGLMDIGVGCFMILNAVVSPEARGKLSSDRAFPAIKKSVKSSLPLFALGFLRIISTKGVNYQEHVTEYGTHWNFFFTLAAVKVLSTVTFSIIPSKLWTVFSLAILVGYQYCLSVLGLSSYIVHGQDGRGGRMGLIDSNREGLCSSIGFLVIYLIGVQLGKYFMETGPTIRHQLKMLLGLVLFTPVPWIALKITETYVEPVSRRFANMSFVWWIIGYSCIQLCLLIILEIIATIMKHLKESHYKKEKSESEVVTAEPAEINETLLESINYNGLFYFLLANLLTGVVNLSIKTIYVQPLPAFVILTLYMFTLSLVIKILHWKKIALKFW